jgi:hypothetical protein
MDYDTYQKEYFTDPAPEPLYMFSNTFNITLYFEDYDPAIAYYQEVLGPPAYREGKGTNGWQIGSGWLTLLKGSSGNPKNVEVTFQVDTPEEAEKLHQKFIKAGGKGSLPSDQLMYVPIRYCSLQDPFGTDILVISPIKES